LYQAASLDGTRIAYDRTGSGPPVVIVGGAFQDRHSGAALARALSEHFTVVTYDRRGRGDSGDSVGYSAAREIEDLGVVISEAGGSASLFGMSSGGVLALEAAAAGYPVCRIATFEPPYHCGEGPELSMDVLPTLLELTRSGRRAETVEYFLTTVMAVPAKTVEMLRRTSMWPGLTAISHTLVYDALVVGNRQWPAARMASVSEPVLVLSSRASVGWMQHTARTVAEWLAAGEHRSVTGAPHDASPRVLAAALIPFFGG